MTAAPFYANQPAPVRAILTLAAMRGEVSAEAWDLVADALFPDHADNIRDIATCLYWIDRLGWDKASDALRAYHGDPTMRFVAADQCADELSAELQREAVLGAQLVASVRLAVAT